MIGIHTMAVLIATSLTSAVATAVADRPSEDRTGSVVVADAQITSQPLSAASASTSEAMPRASRRIVGTFADTDGFWVIVVSRLVAVNADSPTEVRFVLLDQGGHVKQEMSAEIAPDAYFGGVAFCDQDGPAFGWTEAANGGVFCARRDGRKLRIGALLQDDGKDGAIGEFAVVPFDGGHRLFVVKNRGALIQDEIRTERPAYYYWLYSYYREH